MYKIVEGHIVEPRKTWYEDKSYEMTYEIIDGHIFVHLVLSEASKKVFSDIKQKWQDFQLKLYSLGYEYIHTYTEDERVIRIIGGAKEVGEWQGKKVFTWELN